MHGAPLAPNSHPSSFKYDGVCCRRGQQNLHRIPQGELFALLQDYCKQVLPLQSLQENYEAGLRSRLNQAALWLWVYLEQKCYALAEEVCWKLKSVQFLTIKMSQLMRDGISYRQPEQTEFSLVNHRSFSRVNFSEATVPFICNAYLLLLVNGDLRNRIAWNAHSLVF